MTNKFMKGATPSNWNSLCDTCSYALIVNGFRESECIVFCSRVEPNVLIPFKVQNCTGYFDKNRPTWAQMEKLAIEVTPTNTLKPVGFRTKTVDVKEDHDEDELEVASNR